MSSGIKSPLNTKSMSCKPFFVVFSGYPSGAPTTGLKKRSGSLGLGALREVDVMHN